MPQGRRDYMAHPGERIGRWAEQIQLVETRHGVKPPLIGYRRKVCGQPLLRLKSEAEYCRT